MLRSICFDSFLIRISNNVPRQPSEAGGKSDAICPLCKTVYTAVLRIVNISTVNIAVLLIRRFTTDYRRNIYTVCALVE